MKILVQTKGSAEFQSPSANKVAGCLLSSAL